MAKPLAIIKRQLSRKVQFKSVNDLVRVISSYFKYAEDNQKNLTFSGLAVWLGISRSSLSTFGRRYPEYAETIKKAKGIVEAYFEELLLTKNNVAGVIFSLKNNFSWRDEQPPTIHIGPTYQQVIQNITQINQEIKILEGKHPGIEVEGKAAKPVVIEAKKVPLSPPNKADDTALQPIDYD
jgi:hypothetical protein